MRILYCFVLMLAQTGILWAQNTFQLAPPLLRYNSVFFSKKVRVEMAFAEPDTRIYYTLNGSEPTEQSTLYTAPVDITKSFTTVKARVFGRHYLPSSVIEATFIKDGLPIKSVETTPPNARYSGAGAATLTDNKGGSTGISGNTWLGFQTDSVDIVIHLKKKQQVETVLVNLLRDYGSWIFLPEKVDILAFDHQKKSYQIIDSQVFSQHNNIDGASCMPTTFKLKHGIRTDQIMVRLYLVKSLPAWHPGSGNKSWIFVDEVKVY